jgi:hypothetical protein
MRMLYISGVLFGFLIIIFSGCARTEMKNPVHPEPVYIEPAEEEVLIASLSTEATDHISLCSSLVRTFL